MKRPFTLLNRKENYALVSDENETYYVYDFEKYGYIGVLGHVLSGDEDVEVELFRVREDGEILYDHSRKLLKSKLQGEFYS